MYNFHFIASEPIKKETADCSDARSIFNMSFSEARKTHREYFYTPEAVIPLWKDALKKAEHILLHECKNIKIFCHYIECFLFSSENTTSGIMINDALKAVMFLIDEGWDSLIIEEDNDDDERSYRAEQIGALDSLGQVVEQLPLWMHDIYVLSLYEWNMCKKLPHLEDKVFLAQIPMSLYQKTEGVAVDIASLFAAEKDAPVNEKNYDMEVATALAKMSPRAFTQSLQNAENAMQTFSMLKAAIKNRFSYDAPSLGNLEAALKSWRNKAAYFVDLTGLTRNEEIDINNDIVEEDMTECGENQNDVVTGKSTSFKLKTRQDALNRISEISAFLRKTEPHSPIPFLLDKALKWGNMPFEKLLSEIIRNKSQYQEVCEYIGMAAHEQEAS